MLLSDYDSGKPLTARRILAVKQAIDANGVAKARSARIKLETFDSPEVERAALGMGYMKSDLRKLARAAHFYAEAKGVSEMEAMREVGRPGSEANRLMNYGGRFLKNLPKLEAIMARTGTLTGRDVIKNCFPEIRRPGNCDIATIRAWENGIDTASLRNPQAAADILRRNADGLWPENAKLFAQFVVKLPLDAANAADSGQRADSFASEIRQWRDFDLGDLHVTDVADAVKADSNADIAKKMADPGSFGNARRPDAANVYSVMIDDAHRNIYVINGRRFDSSDPNSPHGEDLSRQVIAAFKGAAPSEKAQKALSCLMHQGMMQNFMSLAMKAPPDPGQVAMHERPGADLFVSRDMTTGLFALPLLDNSTMQTTYTLDVAPDGNTATVTVTASPGLTEGFSPGDVFGHVQLTRQMTVDLRPDIPVVTDVKLAQKLVP